MNQRDFAALVGGGRSQADRILDHLRRNAGRWVPMPVLWRVSGAFAVHSRIADLRRRGHRIEQRSERADGIVLSSYRLNS